MADEKRNDKQNPQPPKNNGNNPKKDDSQNGKTAKKEGVKEADGSMSQKVNSAKSNEEDSLLARVIGLGLIVLGVLFIIMALLVVLLARRAPRVDSNITPPSLNADEFTNEERIKVSGKGEDDSKIMFFLDGEAVNEYAEVNSDGEYEFEIDVDAEGEYELQAAAVKGFPIRRRSEKSDTIKVVVDWTVPSTESQFDYEPNSSTAKSNVKGNIDPNSKITLKDGDKEYSATSDDNGDFEIKDIELSEGENEFKVILEDRAGNKRELDKRVVITYTVAETGSINGDGVTTGPEDVTSPELPEAAGELEAALSTLLGNRLMMVFGLIALVVLFINSGVVAYKVRSR